MKKSIITLKCEKCGNNFDYLYIGKGPTAKYCPTCKKQPKIEVESLIYLRKRFITEIQELMDEITGFQLIWLEEPHNDARAEEKNIVDKDFERLESLIEIVHEINFEIEEMGENGNGK